MFTRPALHSSPPSVASPQDGPRRRPCLLVFSRSCRASWHQGWSMWPVAYGRSDMLLPRLGYKGRGLVFNLPLSPSFLFSVFFGSPTNCHVVNTLKHTWNGLHGEEQRPRTSEDWLLPTAQCVSFAGRLPSPSQALRWRPPRLTTWLQPWDNLWASQIHPAKPFLDSWPTEMIVNVCCFKLLNFRVICYTA